MIRNNAPLQRERERHRQTEAAFHTAWTDHLPGRHICVRSVSYNPRQSIVRMDGISRVIVCASVDLISEYV